jgi:hypothetical protein
MEMEGSMATYRYVGCDAAGVPRTWGEADNSSDALNQCVIGAREYIKGRPDTGPVDRWLFEPDGNKTGAFDRAECR